MATHEERLQRAQIGLDGLSVGDALGQRFFHPAAQPFWEQRAVPKPVWRYTDDTVMALGITEVLTHYREIDQDVLAKVFTWRFLAAPDRGYGETAFRILKQIAQRVP